MEQKFEKALKMNSGSKTTWWTFWL